MSRDLHNSLNLASEAPVVEGDARGEEEERRALTPQPFIQLASSFEPSFITTLSSKLSMHQDLMLPRPSSSSSVSSMSVAKIKYYITNVEQNHAQVVVTYGKLVAVSAHVKDGIGDIEGYSEMDWRDGLIS